MGTSPHSDLWLPWGPGTVCPRTWRLPPVPSSEAELGPSSHLGGPLQEAHAPATAGGPGRRVRAAEKAQAEHFPTEAAEGGGEGPPLGPLTGFLGPVPTMLSPEYGNRLVSVTN